MRLLSLLFLSFAMTSCSCWGPCCSFFNPDFDTEVEEIDYTIPSAEMQLINSAQATSIIQDLAIEEKYKHHLHYDMGKTYYDVGIQTIQLEFSSQDLLEICEARELIVDLTENLLAKLNQDPILASDLANYPFNANNLEIYITFESNFGKFVDPYYVHWICMEDGVVKFFLFDLLDNTKSKWHSRRENYITSREIVVYEREAKRKYDEANEQKRNIFGNQRYYPK